MALNKVLGSFKPDNLFAANQELPAVTDSIEIAAGQFLKRGSLVNKDGVLVSATDTAVYAVLARDCDTTDGASEAPVYLTGEFNTDAVKVNDNVDNMFSVCVFARKAGIFLKPHAKMPPVAPMTLRFKFGKEGYAPPTLAKGTWSNVAGDIWDWTCEDSNWATAFGGGNTTNPGAFADLENPVQLIAAGDTSAVTDFSRLFQNCYALVKVCPFDTSGASNVIYMFSNCKNVEEFFDLDFSNATNVTGVFQNCHKMVTAPDIIFPNDSFVLNNFFYRCISLENIPLYNLDHCTSISAMFYEDAKIKEIPKFNTHNVQYMNNAFRGTSIAEMPDLDYSNVIDFSSVFNGCLQLSKLSIINAPKIQAVDSLFYNCKNVERGVVEFYEYLQTLVDLNPKYHKATFSNCGINTESGLAELRQIPASWGGLAEG